MQFSQNFLKQLAAARLYMMRVFPFYGSLFTHLRVIETTEVETAAVSADDRLFINPQFFSGLKTVDRRAFLLAHEVLHPALGIFLRSRGHHPELSNIAHDYVINLILKDEKKEWVLEDCLLDEKYRGMPYEEVYATLRNEAKQQANQQAGDGQQGGSSQGKSKGKGGKTKSSEGESGQPGSEQADKNGGAGHGKSKRTPGGSLDTDILTVEEANKLDPENSGAAMGGGEDDGGKPRVIKAAGEQVDVDRKAKEWVARVISADLAARAQGRGSLGAQRILGIVGTPTVPWHELLRLAIAETNTFSTLDWSSPSRRSEATGSFIPRELMHGTDATVYVDTSGSISQENLKSAIAEIRGILEASGRSVRWLEGDDGILKDEWIGEAPEQVEGGGGTSFVPLFEHLRESPTKTLIVFTDTFGAFPDFSPDYHVIWAVYAKSQAEADGRKVPFGEIIAVPEAAFA